MSKIKGILFDFNGTLFWDSKLHEQAWREFAQKYGNKNLSDEDMKLFVHGRINWDIIKFIFEDEVDAVESDIFSNSKELIYQGYLLNNPELLKLAPGTIELLNFLKQQEIPCTVATSANKSNVDFYFEHLGIGNWFDYSKVVYDDGTFIPKPAPDIFIKAAGKIGLSTSECLVVEDSLTGILSARNAGISKIIFIENDTPVEFTKVENLVDGKITNLMEILKYIG